MPEMDTLITTYLQMTNRADFRPAYVAAPDVSIARIGGIDLRFYRFLYNAVGEQWRWRDRNVMADDELRAKIAEADIHVLTVSGVPAGYIELVWTDEIAIEVAYFGLRSEFFGRGLGKHLLSYGLERGWESGAKRLWVHTCNLDGPHALDNYQKRGFVVYDVVHEPMPVLFSE